jgi:hypothetical protein
MSEAPGSGWKIKSPNTTKMKTTKKLSKGEGKPRIFVFGSNREGHHGAGAAREAVDKWGAKHGQADGLQGSSYAIVTTELRPDEDAVEVSEVRCNIRRFIHFAERHPELEFYVTPVGTGLAGFKRSEILPLFEAEAPSNCILTWKDPRYANLTR